MEYFLLIAGERQGPFSGYDILSKIREGEFKGEELVWRKGLTGWQDLRSMQEFEESWPPTPEMLAAAEEARALARLALDTPQPWLRFWARVVDYALFLSTVWFTLLLFFPSTFQRLLHLELQAAPVESIIIFLFAPVEAWLLSRYGSTPGKSLLRIQMRRLDGHLPTLQQAFTRSLLVFLKGIGLGFPILALFTMTLARLRLLRRGSSSWDEQTQLRVEHGDPEAWRYGAALLLIILAFCGAMILIRQSPEVLRAMQDLQSLPK